MTSQDAEKQFAEYLATQEAQAESGKNQKNTKNSSNLDANEIKKDQEKLSAEITAKEINLESRKNQKENLEEVNLKANNSESKSEKSEIKQTPGMSDKPQKSIQVNFQVSHFYIFGLLAISAILLNFAAYSLIFSLLDFFGTFVDTIQRLAAKDINQPYFDYRGFLDSNFLRSLVLIFLVWNNYRFHVKYLSKIFRKLEIK